MLNTCPHRIADDILGLTGDNHAERERVVTVVKALKKNSALIKRPSSVSQAIEWPSAEMLQAVEVLTSTGVHHRQMAVCTVTNVLRDLLDNGYVVEPKS